MNLSLVSVRYAKALFKLSLEKGILEDIYGDVILLSTQCSGSEDFCEFVKSPVVKPANKKKLFKEVFGSVVHPVTLSFFNLVVDNNREALLTSIFRSFQTFYKKEKNIKTVTLYSAFAMDKEFADQVRSVIAKELDSKIELSVITKDELLGGFILKVDDKMVDASILGKLKKVRGYLTNG